MKASCTSLSKIAVHDVKLLALESGVFCLDMHKVPTSIYRLGAPKAEWSTASIYTSLNAGSPDQFSLLYIMYKCFICGS